MVCDGLRFRKVNGILPESREAFQVSQKANGKSTKVLIHIPSQGSTLPARIICSPTMDKM